MPFKNRYVGDERRPGRLTENAQEHIMKNRIHAKAIIPEINPGGCAHPVPPGKKIHRNIFRCPACGWSTMVAYVTEHDKYVEIFDPKQPCPNCGHTKLIHEPASTLKGALARLKSLFS
ncbi:MAG: hypothetical protein LBB76_00430 [Azoarcus sp.]|nr:hypothetical protein [Azoarcus sp.]